MQSAPVTPPRKTIAIPDGRAPDAPGPVKPTWESIREHYRLPEWLVDAKFGIFIHWGVYSVPAAQSEWYPRHMYRTQSVIDQHRKRFGPQDRFGYKDFIPMFRAERFDPDAWADLFVASGARYVMPVAEHHDGFAMYDSKLTRWDAKDMGPRRDIVGDLMVAVRKRGLKFGVSNHRIEHWGFMFPAAGLKTDLFDPRYADFYGPPQVERHEGAANANNEMMEGSAAPQSQAFLEEWLLRTQEQIDRFRPDLLWFDNGINARGLDPVKLRLAAYYYNRAREWGTEVSLTTKRDAFLAGSVRDYERQWQAPTTIQSTLYQVDDALGDKWGYVEGMGHLSTAAVLNRLIDNVSQGGNLLLNISPRSDGTIPEGQERVLREIGAWLKINGEAIYSTRPWRFAHDGTVRYARKGDTLYAIMLGWPQGPLSMDRLPQNIGRVRAVTLIGSTDPVTFKQNDAGLTVTLPATRPAGVQHAYVLRIDGLRWQEGTNP
ncbi:alpha-L-fucosidase [Sphingomonas sp. FW199]|uniref:alpha-L-fucosidase n=1 Tax=Sphingomonas sp. FW199 TaxID=3400217 RepID=UPI003CE70763